MKKLLSLLSGFGLVVSAGASSLAVVGCSNPEIAHNNFGKIAIDAETYNTAITNWQKHNTARGAYIYAYVNLAAGMNISAKDMQSYEDTGSFELRDQYKNLIIDHFDTTLEELALIPMDQGFDYTMFTFSNWKTSNDPVKATDVGGPGLSTNHYDVDVTFAGTDTTVTLHGVFFHKDIVTQTKMDKAGFEKSFEQYYTITNGSTMGTDVDPTGIGFFIALEFEGPKQEDGRFTEPNTTSLRDLEQKNVDFMSMVMREYGIFDGTMNPLMDYFQIDWEKAIGSLGMIGVDGDTITVQDWTGNSKFGTPLYIAYKGDDTTDESHTFGDGGSYLPAGVYNWG